MKKERKQGRDSISSGRTRESNLNFPSGFNLLLFELLELQQHRLSVRCRLSHEQLGMLYGNESWSLDTLTVVLT